jgi:hypothetical protein
MRGAARHTRPAAPSSILVGFFLKTGFKALACAPILGAAANQYPLGSFIARSGTGYRAFPRVSARQFAGGNVRYGSFADIGASLGEFPLCALNQTVVGAQTVITHLTWLYPGRTKNGGFWCPGATTTSQLNQ